MTPKGPESVVASMLDAVHRRDHLHVGTCCAPHHVEVIHLGSASIAVCHDCGFESDFLSMRDCERAAGDHRLETG